MAERRPLGSPRARRALDQLHDKGLNFDGERAGGFRPEDGWRSDDYRQPLPAEPPGPPLPGGSFAVAKRLMLGYEFADPRIVRAVYYPERPLEQRDMLLEGRFMGLRFHFGCRVGGVNDATRTEDGRQVQVWGWNYRTLQGHLEMGQMTFEVAKWLDSGAVEFRIHAVSKPAHIPNPVIRLGFRLFGRPTQVRFARHACQRMASLTAAELGDPAAAPGADELPRAADDLTVAPAGQAGERAPLARALAIGAVAGMRSQLPFALLSVRSAGGPLAGRAGRAATLLAAAGELVADKLPVTPERTRPGPAAGRVAAGGLAGAALYRDAGRAWAPGAAAGALAAAASTVALARARRALARRTGLPVLALGLAEDALAVGLGLLAVTPRPVTARAAARAPRG